MGGIEVAEVITVLAMFLGGIVLGVLLIVSASIRREDKRRTMRHPAARAAERGTRTLIGVGSRTDQPPGR